MTTTLETLLNLNQQRDDATTSLTQQMLALLTPTVGQAVDALLTGVQVESTMSDILIYDEAAVVIFDLKIHKTADLASSAVLSHISFDDDDADIEGDYYFTNMHITIPVTMAFAEAGELVEFLSKFPIRTSASPFDDDEDDEDADAMVTAFDDTKLTDDQRQKLALAGGWKTKGSIQ